MIYSSIGLLILLSICGRLAGERIGRLYSLYLLLGLGFIAILWIYGARRLFGFQWHLYDNGLQILRNDRELRFMEWNDIATITKGYLVIVAKDRARFPVPLPASQRRDMRKRIGELIDEQTGTGERQA